MLKDPIIEEMHRDKSWDTNRPHLQKGDTDEKRVGHIDDIANCMCHNRL